LDMPKKNLGGRVIINKYHVMVIIAIAAIVILSILIVRVANPPDSESTVPAGEPVQEESARADADTGSTSAGAISGSALPDPADTETADGSGGNEAPVDTEAANGKPLSGFLVGIDAGHQQHGNSGLEPVAPGSSEKKAKVSSGTSGVSSGLGEYELNLMVALKLDEKLHEMGAETVMVRTVNDVDISNAERATMMNDAGVDLCIRIHANGGGSSDTGAMMLVPSGSVSEDIQSKSSEAGEVIFSHYLEATGANDLGVIPRSDLSGFNWSEVPVCLIEMGFMTNSAEDKKLATDAYQDKIVEGLADGICAYLTGAG